MVEEAVVVQQPQREESNGEESMKDAIITALPVIGKPTNSSFCAPFTAISVFRNLARRSMPDAT